MKAIDLNCDLGEGFADDAALMPLISSANIACGGHAGDDSTMAVTVALAIEHGVAVGAHPGYTDRVHFGRREQPLGAAETVDLVLGQVEALARIAGRRLRHVKLHGALYHRAGSDGAVARSLCAAIAARWPGLILFAPSGSVLADCARHSQLRLAEEAFVDRRYASDGGLLPRFDPRAVIAQADDAAAQAIDIVVTGLVRAADGTERSLHADTLCIHGDGVDPLGCAAAVRRALDRVGVVVRAPF